MQTWNSRRYARPSRPFATLAHSSGFLYFYKVDSLFFLVIYSRLFRHFLRFRLRGNRAFADSLTCTKFWSWESDAERCTRATLVTRLQSTGEMWPNDDPSVICALPVCRTWKCKTPDFRSRTSYLAFFFCIFFALILDFCSVRLICCLQSLNSAWIFNLATCRTAFFGNQTLE